MAHNMGAYVEIEYGETWLHIITDKDEWQEPIKGWTYVIDLVYGNNLYRHTDGREFKELHK